jgi:hypothetical protein
MRNTAWLAIGAIPIAGCASVWGFDDLTAGDSGPSSSADASMPGDAPGTESGTDGPTVQCDGGLTACGASCIDSRGDPKNCGACAHDCQGGKCQQAVCQPVLIASGFTGTSDAGGTVSPRFIAVDSTDVYWTVEGVGVMKCAANGCNNQPTLLAPGRPAGEGFGIDATSVYWLDATSSVQSILKCAKGGCASQPMVLVSLVGGAYGIAVGGASAFWTSVGACDGGICSRIAECATGGCNNTPTVFAVAAVGDQGWDSIAASATSVYWGDDGTTTSLMTCPAAGCGGAPITLARGTQPQDIASDAVNVYWWDGATGNIEACALAGCGNLPTTLYASGGQGLTGIASDSTNVYWLNRSTGAVQRCAISGCVNAPTDLVLGLSSPIGLALDTTTVYWTNSGDGTVMKVAK